MFEAASRETPISSGNGDAIKKAAVSGSINFLNERGRILSKNRIGFSFESFFI